MPDAKKKDAAGKGIMRRIGPLPAIGWAGVAVGAWVVYKFIKDRSAASTTSAPNTALEGGTTVPSVLTGMTGTALTGPYSDLSSWEAAALSQLEGSGIGGATGLNAITAWLNGQCVSAAAFQALSGTIATIGLPPGYAGTTVPPLTVCPTTAQTPTTTPSGSGATVTSITGVGTIVNPTGSPPPSSAAGPPPNLPSSLIAAMTNNGEHIVDEAYDATTGNWLYLTQKGGVYAITPTGQIANSGFYGSAIGQSYFNNGRVAQKITVDPGGGYTITDTAGENYNYGPNIPFTPS